MSSTTIATITQMIEPLPEAVQERIVEHLREYILELQDELKWDTLYKKTQPGLIAAAQKARKEIAEGLSKPLDLNQL